MTDSPEPVAEPVEGETVEPGTSDAGTDLVAQAEAVLAAPETLQRPDYRLAMEMGRAMASSGFFADAKEEAQAAVKMIIGLDLGVSPTAAMSAIHIVKGKPQIGYQILAAKINAHPSYSYRVDAHDDETCRVVFSRDGEELGDVEWTLERAKGIGLVKADSGWANYPRNMMLARCISDGVKWYMPDLLTGAAVYVDDEIPEDRRALMPPVPQGPKPLETPDAEAARRKALAAFDQLREIDTELLPPGLFNKMLRDATTSQTELDALVITVEDYRDRAGELRELEAALREKHGDEAADRTMREAERQRSLRERVAFVRDAAEADPEPELPAGADTTDGGE